MKTVFTILSFVCLPVFSQDTLKQVIYEVREEWSCNADSNVNCGTFLNPQLMRYTPIDCPDSMVDDNYIYSLIPLSTPKDPVKRLYKVPSDRNVYFISRGIATDSFIVNLNGTQLLFKQQNSGYTAKIVKQGVVKTFHIDIKVTGLNAIVDTKSDGTIQLIYRRPKQK